MEDQGPSTNRNETETVESQAILTELFGPLADRVCGTGPKAAYAYVNLLLAAVFLRHHARPTWAYLREAVREALDAQSAPRDLIRIIGRLADAALREHRLPPGISAALDDLRSDTIDDLAHVMRLCEDLKPEDFSVLLDRFGVWSGAHGESSFTPRSVVDLIAQILNVDCYEAVRIHDPYVRGGELLVGALRTVKGISLSGASPSADMLRIAGMNLLLSGGQAHLSSGSATPWNQPTTVQADRILTNLPFNQKGYSAVTTSEEDWPFGSPGNKRNYAWLQHIIVSLKRPGKAVVLMPNQAAVSVDAHERPIRERMIRGGAIDFIVALPRELFATTTVPAMIWGLQSPSEQPGSVLFIDIRRAGSKRGKQRVLDPAETRAVVNCLHLWRAGAEGFASALHGVGHATTVSIEEIDKHHYSLDPADYLGDRLLDLGNQDLVNIPEMAVAVKLMTREARMADEKAASIVFQHREMDVESLQRHWRSAQMGELCEMSNGPSYSLVKNAVRADEGVPLIVPSDLRDNRILAGKSERITSVEARTLERFQLRENDILFVRTGTVGPVALVSAREERWLFGTNLIRIQCHEDVDPRYLLAYLSSRPAQRWIDARTQSATAIPSISTRSLKRLPVKLPPLNEQRRIGDLLATADMQITAHRNLADTAADMRTLLNDGLTGGLLVAY